MNIIGTPAKSQTDLDKIDSELITALDAWNAHFGTAPQQAIPHAMRQSIERALALVDKLRYEEQNPDV